MYLDPKKQAGVLSLFWRVLGAIYLVAFLSLAPQILGLVGTQGIDPVTARLGAFWSDGFLLASCGIGAALGAVVLAGPWAPGPFLAGAWLLYLSLVHAGGRFLGFQWESLLLETGWIVLFAAPWRRAPGPTVRPEAPREALFALRFLLFRLMFASGVVKIASGDPTWRDLTALSYHYESQPLPTWIGWWAHQLPLWIQQLTTAGVFTIELALPWLLWSTGPPRRWAALTIAALQILIALTGNYGWFNFLALGLALTALADSELKRLLGSPRGTIAPSKARTWAARIGLAPAVAAGLLHCVALTGWMPVGDLGESLLGYTSYYGLSGGYGLFAVMTRGRSEVVVEGTMDGMEWKPYLFKYKPQDPSRRPGFVEPHMPRLDWQLWFAALGPPQASPWLRAFMVRLLQASPPVLSLLDGDPFGGKPPKAVRARIRPYRMTTPRELLGNGNWWSIGEAEPFGPELWSTPSSS